MPAEIPTEIRPMLAAYLSAFHAQLPDLLSGFFLHGSIALGAFQAEWSDIDFIAILKRPLHKTELEQLQIIHQELIINYDKWQLEGAYLLAEDLGSDSPIPRPNFHDGTLSMGHFERNDLTWWLLKEKGIAVEGVLPDFAVDWERLIQQVHENMNSYWRRFTTDPLRMAWLLSDYGIQWVVLGTLRQCYSFREQAIVSKVGAGEYGLVAFPEWERIIQEALNLRNGQKTSLYRLRLWRAYEAWRFVNFIIKTCNEKS